MLLESTFVCALSFYLSQSSILKCLSAIGLFLMAMSSYLTSSTNDEPSGRHSADQTQGEVERLAAKELCNANKHVCFDTIDKTTTVTVDGVDNITFMQHSIVFKAKEKVMETTPLLLIHGANTGPIFWFDCIPWLVMAGFEVHCLGIPGFGDSTPLQPEQFLQLSSKQMLTFLLASINTYIQTCCTRVKPILVGHSFGGCLASAFACRYHDTCKSIIVSNCPGILPIFGSTTMYWAVLFKFGFPNCLLRMFSASFRSAALQYFRWKKFHASHLAWWNVLHLSAKENIGHLVVSKFVRFDWAKSSWKHCALPELLSVCTTPVAMIWGTDDTIAPFSTAQLLHSMGADGMHMKVVGIDDCWHDPVRKNGGRDYANAIVECAGTCKRFLRLPEQKIAEIKKAIDNASATWSRTATLRSIQTLHTTIAEIVTQHRELGMQQAVS